MASEDSQPFRWHYSEFDDKNFQIRGRTFFFIIVLFSIVLLITLLYLYARWICRFRHLPAPPTASSDAHAPHAPPSQALGLDSAAINSLPIIQLRSPAAIATPIVESECCICLGAFRDGEKVKVLPNCRHCYHSECVDQWLTAQSNCPLCRASLRSDCPV